MISLERVRLRILLLLLLLLDYNFIPCALPCSQCVLRVFCNNNEEMKLTQSTY